MPCRILFAYLIHDRDEYDLISIWTNKFLSAHAQKIGYFKLFDKLHMVIKFEHFGLF